MLRTDDAGDCRGAGVEVAVSTERLEQVRRVRVALCGGLVVRAYIREEVLRTQLLVCVPLLVRIVVHGWSGGPSLSPRLRSHTLLYVADNLGGKAITKIAVGRIGLAGSCGRSRARTHCKGPYSREA